MNTLTSDNAAQDAAVVVTKRDTSASERFRAVGRQIAGMPGSIARWVVGIFSRFDGGLSDRRDRALASHRMLKLSETRNAPEADKLISDIKEAWKSRPCTFQDVYLIEDAVLALKSGESLKRTASVLRHEYEKVVGADEFKIYQASVPQGIDSDEAKLRADLLALQDELHEEETAQRALSGIRTRLTLLSLILCISVVVGFEIQESFEAKAKAEEAAENEVATRIEEPEPVLLDVFVVGVIGGCFSTLLRVQRFQVSGVKVFYRLTSLPWNLLLIFRSLVLGGLGAVVFLVIMRTGIIPLPIFPNFLEPPAGKDALDSIFASVPENALMAARLYLFSFLAGFSERLVPDALTRITDIANEQNK